MAINLKNYIDLRNLIISFFQSKNGNTVAQTSKDDKEYAKAILSENNLRNIVVVFHDFSLTVQYFEDGILNMINIDIENKKLGRNSTGFSDTELRFFDGLGFELFDSYVKEHGVNADDWFFK